MPSNAYLGFLDIQFGTVDTVLGTAVSLKTGGYRSGSVDHGPLSA
jgi:hypothetical protein